MDLSSQMRGFSGLQPDAAGLIENPGPWELVERKVITQAVTTVTFYGLDGDLDRRYKILAYIYDGAGAAAAFTIRPNGLTTNQGTRICSVDGAGVSTVGTTTMAIAYVSSVSLNSVHQILAIFFAHRGVGGLARARGHVGISSRGLAATFQECFLTGSRWTDNTIQVTSLDFVASQASGIGAGSVIEIYREPRDLQ